MNKKSIDRKAAKQFIVANRDQGKTDQEIYDVLTQQYFDKKTIALLITSTVTPENKKKYKTYNTILLGLIGLTILFKVLTVIQLSIALNEMWNLLLILLVPLFSIYLFYEIARYNGSVYRILGLLAIAGFFQSISHGQIDGLSIMINLTLCGAIAGLAFYLDKNMFPGYSPKNLKKDSNGEYILS